jgi:hypothetical protein
MGDWMRRYMSALKGGKIVDAGVGEEDEEGQSWPWFLVEKDGRQFRVEVSQDPEGNGPGFLFGLPEPE